MISFIKMLLVLLFLFCIIVNSQGNKSDSEAELALTSDFQANSSTVDFVKPGKYPVATQPDY